MTTLLLDTLLYCLGIFSSSNIIHITKLKVVTAACKQIQGARVARKGQYRQGQRTRPVCSTAADLEVILQAVDDGRTSHETVTGEFLHCIQV